MTYLQKNRPAEDVKVVIEQSPLVQSLDSTNNSTFTPITYTQIEYQPYTYVDGSTAEFVIYNASFLIHADVPVSPTVDSDSGSTFRLVYSTDGGSTWTAWGDNTMVNFGSYQYGQIRGTTYEVNFCLETTGWTAPRLLRLEGLCWSSGGMSIQLHHNLNFYDQNGLATGNSIYQPTVICRSIK